jgi:hypothetical protein
MLTARQPAVNDRAERSSIGCLSGLFSKIPRTRCVRATGGFDGFLAPCRFARLQFPRARQGAYGPGEGSIPPAVIRLLLERGANPKRKNPAGKTPLQWARAMKLTRVIRLLKGK